MNDLLLWRLLRDRPFQPGEIAPLLRELAGWPLAERRPFLGFLLPALTHADSEVRAAALTALRGAKGNLAQRHLVLALNDPETQVRQAAVQSLGEALAGEDWARWAHVLFHPDPSVRQLAIAAGRPLPPPEWYLLFLLPDRFCAEPVQARLAETVLPPAALPLLVDYVASGVVSRAWAQQAVARMVWEHCWIYLNEGPVTEPGDTIAEILACVGRADGAAVLANHPSRDELDGLVNLFWTVEGETEAGLASVCDAFFDRLLDWLVTANEETRGRVVVSILITGGRQGNWVAGAARIVAVYHPDFLVCPWVPRAVRYAALGALYRTGQRPGYDPDTVRRWLQADVCRLPSGRLDLWAVGGFLHFLTSTPYRHLLQWFDIKEVVAAFHEDVDRAASFLCLFDRSPKGRNFLIREICSVQRPAGARLLALLARAVPSDGLAFLEPLDGRAACELLEQLLLITQPPAQPLGLNKARRLADVLARKIAAGQIGPFLHLWLDRPAPEDVVLAQFILGYLARDYAPRTLLLAVGNLPLSQLTRFLAAANACAGLAYAWEVQLAAMLVSHADAQVRAWAESREQTWLKTQILRLSEPVAAGEPASFKVGLCEQLRRKPDPVEPNLEVCVALLASHDPLPQVDAQFARFGSGDPAFLERLDVEMVRTWVRETSLPLLGHAWLYRWDEHALAFGRQCAGLGDGMASGLRFLDTLSVPALRRRCWEATNRAFEIWQWRDRPRLEEARTEALATLLVQMLSTAEGDAAARILLRWHEAAPGSEVLRRLYPSILSCLSDLGEPIRHILQPWIDSRGLAQAPLGPSVPDEEAQLRQRIALTTDLDFLANLACQFPEDLAKQAAWRLLALGDRGRDRFAGLFRQPQPAPVLAVLATVGLLAGIGDWFDETVLDDLRRLLPRTDIAAETRYRLGEALYQRGVPDLLPDLMHILTCPGPVGWFMSTDWEWLWNHADWRPLCLATVLSPHPHAYQPAVQYLVEGSRFDRDVEKALTGFLQAGTERLRESRLQAARWLYLENSLGDGLPLLLQGDPEPQPSHPFLLRGAMPAVVEAIVAGFLMAGEGRTAEEMILALLKADGVNLYARQEGCTLLLTHGEDQAVRREARLQLRPGLGRALKLRRLADTFAWGVRIGRELTGKLFSMEMISSEKLGYTRFSENKLYITPMPILRGELHGREVVRALILHELGHHIYHRGPEAEAVWQQSEQEKLHSLLNLVADERLERNLRARDRRFGDQLKLLASYAFQHTTREFNVERLLAGLQGQAFEVLSHTHLGFARRRDCVALDNGRVLRAMERAGLSFARFVRALRMGLGNRHNDPEVAEALALFRGKFRRSPMPRLLEIARRLREIFGRETEILDSFAQDESLLLDDDEMIDRGEEITNEELQSEIQRSLEPRRTDSGGRSKGGGGRGLNLSPEEDFNPITKVVPVPYDPARHAGYAQQVARPALKMRGYFHDLGLSLEPERFRLRGKILDRTRIRAVVLRGDPRMLMARELHTRTDLFLAVIIDCSGSMANQNRIERAKLFGTLLAEAARNQPGIDLRLFGFTDQVIYDAGRANRCAVHGLESGGGNNDAAALWHAAQAALSSRRKAKLLVMISDGSPTECSVAALTALVNRLTRRFKICCAQVAVCPLDHICFPNYIVLDGENQEVSVRQFGQVMARLVRQALRGG